MSNSPSDPKKKTPEQWSGPKDARDLPGAGEYPNYWTHRTRTGHVFTLDDSKDAEHVTLQHRGGSMVQFLPDGAVQFVAQNGQYTFTFGENRVFITGAYDVTVQGSASLKVDGDYNVTVKGETNFTVGNDFNLTARSFNQILRGNIDIAAKNRTEKIEGNIAQTALGAQDITALGALTVASAGDAIAIGAAKSIGISAGDELMARSKNKTSVIAENSDIAVAASAGKIGMKSSDKMILKGSQIRMNDEEPPAPKNAKTDLEVEGGNDVKPQNYMIPEF